MNAVMPRLTTFADGITAVDTEYVRPQMDASHIVVAGDRAAVVDTGPNTAVPLILAALEQLQIAPDAVELAVPHPRAPRSCRRRRRAHARAAARHLRGASARRASHDRSRKAHRRHPGGVWRRALLEALWRNPARRSRTPGDRAGRPAFRNRRPRCSSVCTRPGTPCITRPSSTTPPAAFSRATPSASPIASSIRRRARGSCPPPRPRSSIPGSSRPRSCGSCSSGRASLYLTHYSEVSDCARLANDMVDAIDEFVKIARAAGPDDLPRMRGDLRRLAHEGAARTWLHHERGADRRHPRQGLRAQCGRADRLAQTRG